MEAELTGEKLGQWGAELERREVDLKLPKFEIAGELDGKKLLEGLGVKRAFEENMELAVTLPRGPLLVSEVLHRGWIRVDEKGTEAAAATVVAVKALEFNPEQQVVEFHVDHPFMFLVRDERSGAVLFFGRVVDPGASRAGGAP